MSCCSADGTLSCHAHCCSSIGRKVQLAVICLMIAAISALTCASVLAPYVPELAADAFGGTGLKVGSARASCRAERHTACAASPLRAKRAIGSSAALLPLACIQDSSPQPAAAAPTESA